MIQKRNRMLNRLYDLLNHVIELDAEDKEFLLNFPDIKEKISIYINEKIYTMDYGRWCNADIRLVIKNNGNTESICSITYLETYIKDTIIKMYPFTKEEIEIAESVKRETLNKYKNKQKNKIYSLEDKVQFGKYKGLKWKHVTNKNYISWLIKETPEGNFKDFLIGLNI